MKLEADLHTHTIASGHAYSTFKEMVEAADQKGLKMIAITDHGPNMSGAPDSEFFFNTIIWSRMINGVHVLRGIEANIIDTKGQLDLPDEILDQLDIVLAGFHTGTGYRGSTVEDNTKAMIAALENPRVHIITHPGNPRFPIDFEKVVLAARDCGKALEINNSSFFIRPKSIEFCVRIAELAKEHGVMVAVNSDAHIYYQVGDFSLAMGIIDRAGIEKSQIINSSTEHVRNFLTQHGKNID